MAIEDEIIRAAGREVANRMMPTRRDDYQRHDRTAYIDRDRSRSPRSLSSNSYTSYSGSSRGVSPSYGRHDAASDWGHRASYGRDTFRDYRDGRQAVTTAEHVQVATEDVAPAVAAPEAAILGGTTITAHAGKTTMHASRNCVALQSTLAPRRGSARYSRPTRDRAGHPLFPDVEDGEDDELRSALEEVKPLAHYEGREKERHEKALLDERNGHIFHKVTDAPSLEKTGLWTTAGPITTHAQAVNLMRWVHHGDPTAMEFLRRTVTRLGTDPTLPRTIGEVTTLQYQNQAMARYNATVNGEREPAPKLTNAGHAPTVTHGAHQAVPGAGPPQPYDAMDEDDPMPANTDASNTMRASGDGGHDNRPPDGAPAHRHDGAPWHDGIDSASGAMVWECAHIALAIGSADLTQRAAHHDERVAMAPRCGPKRGESSVDRSAFLKIAIRILSVKGFFDKYATLAGYLLNDLPLEHFPFPGVNVSFAHVIAWLMQHGIDKGSEALLALESFACARRRHAAGKTEDLQKSLFNDDWPHCPDDADNIVLRPEDLWTGLQFGSPRPGETTDFPSHPAGAPATMENGKVYPPLPPSPKDDVAPSTGV
ncbi:hypothetical protein DFH06DRAFT_1134224 [Mycena polygramma]|nr:hypothetical protein DFH06DRAFT_1134224 [Mycena polygramma]